MSATLEGSNAPLAARHRDPEILGAIQRVLTQGAAAAKAGEEHAAILRAVASGDEDLATLLATRHVINAGAASLSPGADSGSSPLDLRQGKK